MFKRFFEGWVQQTPPTSPCDTVEASLNQEEDKNQKAFNAQQRRVVMMIFLIILFVVCFALLTKKDELMMEKPAVASKEPVFSSPIKGTLKEHAVLRLQESVSDETKARETLETELGILKRRLHDTETTLDRNQAWLQAFEREWQAREANTNTVVTPPAIGTTPIPSFRTVTTTLTSLSPTLVTDEVVPAGSYVTAILLSGVDVSAGVNAMSDPKPVLLRTVKPINLPNGKTVDIQNCRIVGASFGEVSSERAYIRLERMSCFVHEAWVDIPVFGYVAGVDGKAGIRGKVVMRDKAMLSRAFLGGLVGGLGDTLSNQLTTTHINPLGSTVSVEARDSLAYGTGSGINTAATHMADYYIKRAEQYQPVIQVMAGTMVDVVFHQGFSLTDEKADKNAAKDESAPLAKMFDWDEKGSPVINKPQNDDIGGMHDE